MKQGFDNISASKTFKMLKDSVLCFGHPYVEIGGVKWATMNVGANSVTDYGLYFQWGDTQGYTASQVGKGKGKKPFMWLDYKWTKNRGCPFTKYNDEDGLATLEASEDAVTAAWGRKWRMPTEREFAALRDAVTEQWVTDYQGSGVKGMVFTDKTDNSKVLFFPACGIAINGIMDGVGDYGCCWSSSLKADYGGGSLAYNLYFSNASVYWKGSNGRYYGGAIRGVLGE